VYKPTYDVILLMYVRTYRPTEGTFTFCVSAGAKKRTTLDTNNTNTAKAALNNSIYSHRTITVV